MSQRLKAARELISRFVDWEIRRLVDLGLFSDIRLQSTARAVFFAAKRLWTAQRQLRFSFSHLPCTIFNDLNDLNLEPFERRRRRPLFQFPIFRFTLHTASQTTHEVSMSFFEAVMLICFGISWPISIAKALRTKVVAGKSPFFMAIVCCGYLSGILHKLIYDLNWVIALYCLNAIMVATDLALYLHYAPNQPEDFSKPILP
jgi:uncharacterized membrane protein